jgi:hypothetical protein
MSFKVRKGLLREEQQLRTLENRVPRKIIWS